MNEFTVIEETTDDNETGFWVYVVNPLGQRVYKAQYSYMASDKAKEWNRVSAPLLERIAELEAAFGKIQDEIESYIEHDNEFDVRFGVMVMETLNALKKAGGNE